LLSEPKGFQQMKFGPIPIDQSPGKILGHNIAGPNGRRLFRKGHTITPADLPALRRTGRSVVYVAQLEDGDVDEDSAARRIADAVMGPHLYTSRAATGRVNLKADALGVLRVDAARLHQLNSQLGITLATLPHHTAVPEGKMVGTVKIIPVCCAGNGRRHHRTTRSIWPLLWLDPLPARRVAVILSGSPSAAERVQRSFDPPLRNRLETLGSRLDSITYLPCTSKPSSSPSASRHCRADPPDDARGARVGPARGGL
jgi:molybdenum cofactor cytidylyltransferase